MLLPILVLSLIGGGYYVKTKKDNVPSKGTMTPERVLIFETALNQVKESDKLRNLAKAFREQGLGPQADMLEKRANLRDLPSEVKAGRREAFRKAMASSDPVAVENMVALLKKEGAAGAADKLSEHAKALRAQYSAQAGQPVAA